MIAVLLAIGIAGHFASPLLLPKAELTLVPAATCDLRTQACRAHLPDGGHIELGISPRPVPASAPLRIDVSSGGLMVKRIDVDFAGETMNMGVNRIQLANIGSGRYSGEATLPVCVSGSMRWIVTVLVETDRRRIAVPYVLTLGG